MRTERPTDVAPAEGVEAVVVADASAARGAEASASFSRRARRWFWHRAVRLLMLLHNASLAVATVIGRWVPRRPSAGGVRVLLTGRFDSDNWILAHVRPLSASKACACVWIVSTNPVPAMDKVTAIYPSRWLVRMAGATGARLLVWVWTAIRLRPEIVGGFHLLVNGLVAIVTGRLVRARSMYFCVGGPVEVLDGAVLNEGGPFCRMETSDRVVERRLLRAVAACDVVITMGTRAAKFFRQKGVNTHIHVVSGGIHAGAFAPSAGPRPIDIICVARMTEIKRLDTLLQAVHDARARVPSLSACLVGDGPLRGQLEQRARDLGIESCVRFVGHQKDVGSWLRQAKIFMLTSRSEGLSLALMEAMMCGLPAIVSNVGDLADLVEDGVNGYLAPPGAADRFAARIVELLADPVKYAEFSQAARAAAMRYETNAVVQQWDRILTASVRRADGNAI